LLRYPTMDPILGTASAQPRPSAARAPAVSPRAASGVAQPYSAPASRPSASTGTNARLLAALGNLGSLSLFGGGGGLGGLSSGLGGSGGLSGLGGFDALGLLAGLGSDGNGSLLVQLIESINALVEVLRGQGAYASLSSEQKATAQAPASGAPVGLTPAANQIISSPSAVLQAGPSPTKEALAAVASSAAPPSDETAAYLQRTARPMALGDFPKPPQDNGRGLHWVPTPFHEAGAVDRLVPEAREMGVKWVVFLNDGTKIGPSDYLIQQLVANGIEPVMRIYTANGAAIQGDLGALVRHARSLGVHYFQLYNEPNLRSENQGQEPDPSRYLDSWLPAAKTVIANGGLPGFGSLSPGGHYDDMEFLKAAIGEVKRRGEERVFNASWLSMHNYTLNHPLEYEKDSNGFLKFRFYDRTVREMLGRSLPIIGTEGGTHMGSANDSTFPAITEELQTNMVADAYRRMLQREPYNFAYTYWVIANEEGGGHDPSFSQHALFQPDYTSPIVGRLKAMTGAGRATV